MKRLFYLISILGLISIFAVMTNTLLGQSRDHGLVEIHAIDAETGAGIPNIRFSRSNTAAEDWEKVLGKTNRNGVLRFSTPRIPGYYCWVSGGAREYQVVSLDEVEMRVRPGEVVQRTFYLRKLQSKPSFPSIQEPNGQDSARISVPTKMKGGIRLESTVSGMPGFDEDQVKFSFYPGKNGRVTTEQLEFARRIVRNGERVRAAVMDELTWFHNTENLPSIDSNSLKQIRIEIEQPPQDKNRQPIWTFCCRLPNGLRLKQHGYRIHFHGLLSWDLVVPDYLQHENAANRNAQVASQWTATAPQAVMTGQQETAKILKDKSVQFSLPTPTTSEPVLRFDFQKPATISRLRLELLPDLRFDDRRLGRQPTKSLLLFEVVPTLSHNEKTSQQFEWSYCWNPDDPRSEEPLNCIDSLSDTCYTIQPLAEMEVARTLILTLDRPVTIPASSSLNLRIESGGASTLDTLARIRASLEADLHSGE